MSDPEDVHDGAYEVPGDFIYQLRRIGPAATLPKVPDVMVLRMGLTKIGRGQHNDFYIDSATLKNFISRSHVEIYGKKNENGKIEFVLNDKGLNGTFINDVRTDKTCVLEEGSKITFGHTNGYKIERGSYAEQPYSEFQFIFEKIPRASNLKSSERFSEVTSTTLAEADSSSTNVDHKKDSNVPDRSFLSDIQSNLQSVQSQISKLKSRKERGGRKDSDSESSDSEPVETSRRNSSSVSHSNDRSSTKTSGSGELAKPPVKKLVDNNRKSTKRKVVEEEEEEEENKKEEEKEEKDDSDKEKDSDNEEEEEEEEEKVEEKPNVPISRISRSAISKSKQQVPTSQKRKSKDDDLQKTIAAKDEESEEEEEEEEEEESEEEKMPVKKNVPKRKFPPKRKPVPQSRSSRSSPVAAAAAATKTKKARPPPSSESEESSEDEASKPEADRRPSPAQSKAARKAPPPPLPPPPPSRHKKKPQGGNSAPAIGSRKRRRKGGAGSSNADASGADLEPGVEWYDDETCESADCKRPKKKRTPWVQCDDCDAWYHTVCVGANYNALLKDSDAHFNCGCVKSD